MLWILPICSSSELELESTSDPASYLESALSLTFRSCWESCPPSDASDMCARFLDVL